MATEHTGESPELDARLTGRGDDMRAVLRENLGLPALAADEPTEEPTDDAGETIELGDAAIARVFKAVPCDELDDLTDQNLPDASSSAEREERMGEAYNAGTSSSPALTTSKARCSAVTKRGTPCQSTVLPVTRPCARHTVVQAASMCDPRREGQGNPHGQKARRAIVPRNVRLEPAFGRSNPTRLSSRW
jgi:hypothetical protein